jgi:hypothetical protein
VGALGVDDPAPPVARRRRRPRDHAHSRGPCAGAAPRQQRRRQQSSELDHATPTTCSPRASGAATTGHCRSSPRYRTQATRLRWRVSRRRCAPAGMSRRFHPRASARTARRPSSSFTPARPPSRWRPATSSATCAGTRSHP